MRYLRAKKRKKTLRLKVGDFKKLTSELDQKNIPVIVLRWWESIPEKDSKDCNDDVDCLVDENNIWPIIKLASKNPGKIKIDLYGICGRNGTSYKGMPYYPPILAKIIYQSRIWNDGYYIPSPNIYRFSFIYHVVYHKGLESGINFDQVESKEKTNKFYKELTRLKKSDLVLKEYNITLIDLHNYLKLSNWSMPLDLMSRWNSNYYVIRKIEAIEKEILSTIAKQLKGMIIFVIRNDAYIGNSIHTIRSTLSKKFYILAEQRLSNKQANSVMNSTRGGNWIEKKRNTPTSPTEIWICKPKNQNTPVSKKMRKKYPLVENFEVLIKREIREKINKIDDANRAVIHASDNDIESAIIINSIFNENTNDEIRELRLML